MDGIDIAYSEHLEFTSDGTDDLLESLVQRQFFLEFQPISQIFPNHIIGFEALIRLASVKGPIPAQAFVPMAERNGAMDPIGFWALEEATQVARIFEKTYGAEAPFISVNLSAVQLELDNFIQKFQDKLKPFHLDANKLVIDIAQSVFQSKRPNIIENISKLKEYGHRISMDGFNPRLIDLNHTFPTPLVDFVKWPIGFSAWKRNENLENFLAETVSYLEQQNINVIFHKIDQSSQYNELIKICAKHMGQGYILGAPMGLENSLKIYNRQHKAMKMG